MIEAARNGLRVDLTNVPESPSLGQSLPGSIADKGDFVVVQEGDCTPKNSSREETFASLEKALKSQYEVSKAVLEVSTSYQRKTMLSDQTCL